ncbi:hypothetical protein [Methanobacterium paludis]|uniref:Uncharacterized protein n=1 Tax=Methanobacterium paludis (strain DSM 25820 / JCM 18151 / SWAN1) TaxID=868131 RepID=F6D2Q6_METPW|nr:hypothetical protein [Methanobacterium paludis]AEG18635.1 hypothetical protein MSWAN_1624 [Methanobacterium paludis]
MVAHIQCETGYSKELVLNMGMSEAEDIMYRHRSNEEPKMTEEEKEVARQQHIRKNNELKRKAREKQKG